MTDQDLIDFGIWRRMTDCAYCNYRAPSEEAIREHSERAGLPVTELTRMDGQFNRDDLE